MKTCRYCAEEVREEAIVCRHCGKELKEEQPEKVLFKTNSDMIGSNPALFLISLPLVFVCGIGLIFLIWMWGKSQSQEITITTKRTILRKGFISKYTSEVLHDHIRNVQIDQRIIQRMMNIGTIGISSSAQADMEIEFTGLKDPHAVKKIIESYRRR